jgi:TIR domain-containing protein
MAAAGQQTPQIFISYSHKDREWLERLQVFLKPLERAEMVERWDDTRIKTGERWHDEIQKALASAQVAVLLVSADFLASDFIANKELPPLLAAEQARGLVVMPVILKPCRFAKTPSIAQFQAVNPGLKPLLEMTEAEREALWNQLTDNIEEALKRPR